MRNGILFLGLALCTQFVSSFDLDQVKGKIKEISSEKDVMARLQKYDQLASELASEPSTGSSDAQNDELLTSWQFEKHDDLVNNKTYYLFISHASGNEDLSLVVQYTYSKIPGLSRVDFFLPDPWGGFKHRDSTVTYFSIEGEKPIQTKWTQTANQKGLTFPEKLNFFKYIREKSQLFVRIYNPENPEGFVDCRFDVFSLENAASKNGLVFSEIVKLIK